MSQRASLQQSALRAISRFFRAPLPVSPRPAEPISGLLGNPGLFSSAASPIAKLPPENWEAASREAHRHAWFPALSAVQPEAATQAMLSWLRQDLPGQGIAWEHPSDAAVRLLHWHAGLAFLGEAAPASLREGLAGSALWQLQALERGLPIEPEAGLRQILHFCGMIAGGFTFPSVPGARQLAASGLAGLRYQLGQQLFSDGPDQDHAPHWLAEVLWAVLIARSIARAQGAPFPALVDTKLAQGARYLQVLAGEIGTVPAIGESALPILPHSTPLAWSLWNAVLSLGLEKGDPASEASSDPRLSWLKLAAPSGAPVPLAGKTWALWSFREAGLHVAWMRIKNQPSRIVASFGNGRGSPLTHKLPLSVLWDVGATQVLSPSGILFSEGCSKTLRARVDGKKARIEGQCTTRNATHHRDLLLNQARLICTDLLTGLAGPIQLHWKPGPGWTLTAPSSPDASWSGTHSSGLNLVIQLPSSLQWELDSVGTLVGSGSLQAGTNELISSFEIR